MSLKTSAFVTMHKASIDRDPSRMVTRFVLPREDEPRGYLRAQQLVDRLDAVPTHDAAAVVQTLQERFVGAHENFTGDVIHNATVVDSLLTGHTTLDEAHQLLIGMAFTSEFATESAAVCNPSAVVHPDQSGLKPGSLRVALGIRAIGEGHISSLCFAEAIISNGTWRFLPRAYPLAVADVVVGGGLSDPYTSERAQFERKIEMASTNVGQPPSYASAAGLMAEERLNDRRRSNSTVGQGLGRRAGDTVLLYQATFSSSSKLTQRVLLPEVFDEAHGVEDARFVLTTTDDGTPEYRASYVAFDGSAAVPRLMVSPDLQSFEVYKMTGPATADKGLALFPRKVKGEHLALTRTGWQDISLARSVDGLHWYATDILYTPSEIWEILKAGNCGSPLEIEQGWLVITHGVGPMRGYAIGAILLDKADPTIVIGRLTEPFIFTEGTNTEGYVPNVVYSCGGIVHEGTLWLPFAEGDNQVRVASVEVRELLAAMVR
jgi:predicted GH43/DUF377 family glycosyl hydrolase